MLFFSFALLTLSARAEPAPRALPSSSALLAATCVAGDKACPIRVRFARGAVSANVRATMRGGKDEKWFVFSARRGQKLRAVVGDIKTPEARVAVFLYAPGGINLGGEPGGTGNDSLPVSGDYFILVRESLARGPAFKGSFTLRLEIR